MNQRKAGAIISYISFFFTIITGLLYTPYMLRMMGQSEYGINHTAASLTAYLSLLSFGVGGAYLRFVSQCRAKKDLEAEKSLNGAFLLIFAILGTVALICGAGIIAFAGVLVEKTFTDRELVRLQIVMVFGVLNMALTFLFNPIMMAIQSKERYLFLRGVNLAASIIQPIINVVALYFGGKAIAITVISFVISVILFILYLIYAVKVLEFSFTFKGIKFSLLKEVFIFSSFLFLGSITEQITNSTDNVVLGAVSGTTAVAIYAVGAQFKNYFMNFSTAISNVFSVQVNTLVAEGKDAELDHLFVRVGRIQFYVLALFMIGFGTIGYDFVCIWAGKDYDQAYLIAMLLMLAIFVPLFQNVGLEIQKAKNKHKARSIVYLLIAVANLAMTIPMSMKWGGVGAALATMISMFVGAVLFMNYYYQKYIGLDIIGFWKSIFSIVPSLLPSIAVGFVLHRYWDLNSYWRILVAALAILVTYMLFVWLFSMNSYEKDLICSPVRKILNKKVARGK